MLLVGVLGIRLGILFANVDGYAKSHIVTNALLGSLPIACFAGALAGAVFLRHRRKISIRSLAIPLFAGAFLGLILAAIVIVVLTVVIASTARFFFV